MLSLRRTDPDLPVVTLGLAIDLDEGFLYARWNGIWRQMPGSTSGLQVKLNRSYRAAIAGSSNVRELFARKSLKINLGEEKFAYALPDGYRAMAGQ